MGGSGDSGDAAGHSHRRAGVDPVEEPAPAVAGITYEDVPTRRWRRRRGDGSLVLVETATYRKILALIGRTIRAGGAVDAHYRIVTPEPVADAVYETVSVHINPNPEPPKPPPGEPLEETLRRLAHQLADRRTRPGSTIWREVRDYAQRCLAEAVAAAQQQTDEQSDGR